MCTVTEPVMLANGDQRQVFTPGDEVPDEWEIPEEYLFTPSEPKAKKAKVEATPPPSQGAEG